MSKENLGEKLRRLRLENHLPLRKVAAALDIDIAILSKMERGERKLTKRIVQQLAKIYNHDPEDLEIHYLGQLIFDEVGEEDLALKGMMVAEEQIRYKALQKNKDSELVKFMEKPTPVERVKDVQNAISNIREFIRGATPEIFANNIQLQSAVLFKFIVIGEAIRNIDDTILNKYQYPWHIPKSFLDFIIHYEHNIKTERIYSAVNDLGELEMVMKQILQNEF